MNQESTSPRREAAFDPAADDAAGLAHQLAYLEMGEGDRQRLRAIAPVLTACAREFVERFYQHLFRFDETARFLQDSAVVDRLKAAQQSHLESMLEARWDEEYANRRRRVGDKHAQVGINPRVFLGAYNQYLQFCLRKLADQNCSQVDQFVEQSRSLLKAVFFDIGLTLDAYFLQATQNFRKALDMLYRANTELRQFAQLTSHDLKTPLATMANLCDEALDEFGDQMPAGARELIEAAKNRAYRMSETIDELLASTLAADPDGSQAAFASELVIHQAAEPIRPLLKQKQIELVIAPPLPLVCGDPVKIREAFYNLLSNAAKFIDKQPGRIHVSASVDGPDCIFCVADNGPGIPPDELQRIFVPFRRLPIHGEQPGSGLGLYFTKNLIEQQSGHIWVESMVGQGSRFYVQLKADGESASESLAP